MIAGAARVASTRMQFTNTRSRRGLILFAGGATNSTAKFKAGIADLRSEAMEGAKLLEEAAERATNVDDYSRLRELIEKIWTAELC